MLRDSNRAYHFWITFWRASPISNNKKAGVDDHSVLRGRHIPLHDRDSIFKPKLIMS